MTITSNIREKIQRLEAIAASGNIDVADALTAGVNAARGLMQNRIFNTGKDASGESFGRYTGHTSKPRKKIKNKQFSDALAYTPYEKERLQKGRQIEYKDLEFFGSLRRAIVTANDGNARAVCIIDNPQEKKIAEYQEQQIANIRATGFAKGTAGRVNIFGLSDEERSELKNVTNAALKEIYDRLLNIK